MRNLPQLPLVGLLAGMVLSVCLPASAQSEEALRDLRIVRQRMLEPLLAAPVDSKGTQRLAKALRVDGSWPDVEYGSTNLMAWRTSAHLGKVMALARARVSPKSDVREDEQIRKALSASLNYWLDNDFRCKNWWWNEIGVPRSLSRILLMLDEELTDAQRKKGLAILARAKLGMTGQNLVWVAEITAKRAILQRNPALFQEAVDAIADQLRMMPRSEGMQPDYSFRQHGPVLYSHGYGAGFVTDCSRTAALVSGTRFAFSAEETDNLSRLILDGHQWMMRGSQCDYGAIGREISRRGRNARYMHGVAQNMLKLSTGREEEFRALADRARGDLTRPLEGNRHFRYCDIMTHHRKGYYASARMYSERIENTDFPCGGEGSKSHHIADGCNFLFRTGGEYFDIFPAWDWLKVPGTTVVQTPSLTGKLRMKGSRSFVGGVSDGRYGLAAMDFLRNELAVRKAWFFFDDEYVCLGAGIRATSDYLVATTVNQCLLRGEVLVGGGRKLEPGRHELSGPTWIHHDRVAYLLPGPAKVHLHNEVQKGSWREINRERSGDEVTREVFKLWIDHGAKPDGGKYAYIVVPDVSAAAAARLAEPGVNVVANRPQVQAVWHEKLKMAAIAFYEPGSITARAGLSIGVDKPCLLLLAERPDRLTISVANPLNKKLTVRVDISRNLAGGQVERLADGATSRVTIELPGGTAAGKSVVRSLKTLSPAG